MKKILFLFFFMPAVSLCAQGSAPRLAPAPRVASSPGAAGAPNVGPAAYSAPAQRSGSAPYLAPRSYVAPGQRLAPAPYINSAPRLGRAPYINSSTFAAPVLNTQSEGEERALFPAKPQRMWERYCRLIIMLRRQIFTGTRVLFYLSKSLRP
ncbi:hypothetical protein Dip510_001060 [Elusimicrobium posterum]